jgi:hypothetical protein
VGLLTAVLLSAGLAACGSGTDSYCSTLKDDQKRLASLSTKTAKPGRTGTEALSDTVSLLAGLRDKAPDDIRGDWDTLVEALDGLARAIKESGADPGDFRRGTRPAGVTGGQLRAVRQAAAELRATPVQQASRSIEQHAQDVCKVDLGSELDGTG